jgi:glycine/D-amino acid oxidase-like deaminating enzyme
MDLRTGEPYWRVKNGVPAAYAALARDETCEVAILGGGITGALVAHAFEDAPYGTDHNCPAMIERKAQALAARFGAMFPDVPIEPSCAWGGTFGDTPDGLAYIGATPEYPGAYFALGYGGNGITFGAIAARIIVDLFMGRPNDDAAIFRFGR